MATNGPAKPSNWGSMTKAEKDSWKSKNYDSSKKVTQAQIKKLRAAGTPDKAIAKYKNDASMREALNRYYGKDRVAKVAGSTTSTNKMGTPRKESSVRNSTASKVMGAPRRESSVKRPGSKVVVPPLSYVKKNKASMPALPKGLASLANSPFEKKVKRNTNRGN